MRGVQEWGITTRRAYHPNDYAFIAKKIGCNL